MSMNIKIHEKKGYVDLDAMMSEFKQVLGGNYKLSAHSTGLRWGGEQLIVDVPGIGSFFCEYRLVYNGGSFKVTTDNPESEFENDCDFKLYKRLEAVFNRYCGG